MKKISLYLAGAFILGIVSGYMTYRLISLSRSVEVPLLTGKSLTEARELLRERGLYLKAIAEDYDPTVPEGYIIRQDVPPAKRVSGSEKISVTLSKGPMTLSMPDVLGKTTAEADKILIGKGLKVSGIIYAHSDVFEEGKVIAQKPAPNEKTGEAITLVASAGPYDVSYYCPSFEGMRKEEALGLAEKLGLKPETTGTGEKITEQQPKPGTEIKAGSKILLRLEEETVTE